MSDKKNDWYVSYATYGAAGIQLAVSVIAGLFLGNYLDKKIGTLPWLTVTGLVVGFVSGFYNLIRIMNWHRTKKGDEARPSHSDSA